MEVLLLLVDTWIKSKFDASVMRMCGVEALKIAQNSEGLLFDIDFFIIVDLNLSISALKLYGCLLCSYEIDDIHLIGRILSRSLYIGQKEWKSARSRGSLSFQYDFI